MPATNFSEAEWSWIVSPAKTIALQKSRIASSMPKAMLYGSTNFNCYILEEPYKKQGILKIATYLQEASDDSTT